MIQKMPGTPTSGSSTGAATSETMNEPPMLMPITAIARVRTSVRVRSASSAVTGPEMAPAPWTRPAAITPQMDVASPPTAEPATYRSSPARITGRRPMRSESAPKGICRQAWVSP